MTESDPAFGVVRAVIWGCAIWTVMFVMAIVLGALLIWEAL